MNAIPKPKIVHGMFEYYSKELNRAIVFYNSTKLTLIQVVQLLEKKYTEVLFIGPTEVYGARDQIAYQKENFKIRSYVWVNEAIIDKLIDAVTSHDPNIIPIDMKCKVNNDNMPRNLRRYLAERHPTTFSNSVMSNALHALNPRPAGHYVTSNLRTNILFDHCIADMSQFSTAHNHIYTIDDENTLMPTCLNQYYACIVLINYGDTKFRIYTNRKCMGYNNDLCNSIMALTKKVLIYEQVRVNRDVETQNEIKIHYEHLMSLHKSKPNVTIEEL